MDSKIAQKSTLVNRILSLPISYFNSTMLSASHNRAYQDFLTLLTEFTSVTDKQKPEIDPVQIKQEFQRLSQWFVLNIAQLGEENLSPEIAPRWQAVQTEILREFKLLSTDMLFLAAARQDFTQQKRLTSIKERLAKLIGYCQILLNNGGDKI